jgi:hypothetical protein
MNVTELTFCVSECLAATERIASDLKSDGFTRARVIDSVDALHMALKEMLAGLNEVPSQPTQRPSIGRIVYFTTAEGDHAIWPAIITEVYSDRTVSLCIFPSSSPALDRHAAYTGDHINKTDAPPGTEEAAGFWNWPPRV